MLFNSINYKLLFFCYNYTNSQSNARSRTPADHSALSNKIGTQIVFAHDQNIPAAESSHIYSAAPFYPTVSDYFVGDNAHHTLASRTVRADTHAYVTPASSYPISGLSSASSTMMNTEQPHVGGSLFAQAAQASPGNAADLLMLEVDVSLLFASSVSAILRNLHCKHQSFIARVGPGARSVRPARKPAAGQSSLLISVVLVT